MEGQYLHNPLQIIKINPITKEVLSTHCIIGSVPSKVKSAINKYDTDIEKFGPVLKEYFGTNYKQKLLIKPPTYLGGDEALFERLLSGETDAPVKVGKYYFLDVYEFDRFYEVREKIALATQVPIHKQHLFYTHNGIVEGFYTMKLFNVYDIKITDIGETKDFIYDIPIDKTILSFKNDYNIVMHDLTQTLDGIQTIYLVDLDNIFDLSVDSVSVLNNTFELELIYYGFILKYFPQMSLDLFKSYLKNEDIYEEYPALQIDTREKFLLQSELTNKKPRKIELITSVSNSTIQHTLGKQINCRNLFDLFETTDKIPALYLIDGKYVISKTNIYADSFNGKYQEGVNFIIDLTKYKIKNNFLKSVIEERVTSIVYVNINDEGVLRVNFVWESENEIKFEHNEFIVKTIINEFIADIGTMIGRPLRLINVVNYSALNVSIIWRHILSSEGFKRFRDTLNDFIAADIISLKQSKVIGVVEYLFKKGMHEFENDMPQMNQYSYLTTASASNYVQYNLQGKLLYIFHKITNIKFELFNVSQDEFETCIKYITILISIFSKEFKDDDVLKDDYSRLKKLKELDPELFDIKKIGSEKTYSEICQQKYQPDVISKSEYDKMPKKDKDRVVEYWNFTLEQPAYYYCDSDHAKHTTFIVGKHPKNYCLPCCKKISSHKNEVFSNIMSECTKNYIYEEKKTVSTFHILGTSKNVPIDRIAQVPIEIKNLLQSLNKTINLFLYGIKQKFIKYNVGILYLLEYILGDPIEKIIVKFIDRLTLNKALFNVFVGGALPTYFTPESLLDTLRSLFIEGEILYNNQFNLWNDLFIEMAFCFLNIILIGLTDKEVIVNKRIRLVFETCGCSKYKIVLYYKYNNSVYPIIRMNDDKIAKTFCEKNSEIQTIVELLNWKVPGTVPDLFVIEEFCKKQNYKIKQYYLQYNNVCYGLLIDGPQKNLYFPIKPTYIGEGKKVTFKYYEFKGPKLLEMVDVINKFNKFVLKNFPNYITQSIVRFIKIDNKVVAIKTTSFVWHCYDKCSEISKCESVAEYESLSGVVIGCNNINLLYPLEKINDKINTYIKDRKKYVFSDKQISAYTEELYKNVLYQQLIYELVNIIDANRNEKIRGEITSLIKKITNKNTKEIISKIQELTSRDDFMVIDVMLRKYIGCKNIVKLFSADFSSTKFEFDNLLLDKIKASDNVVSALKDIFEKVIIRDGDLVYTKYNMIFPCNAGVGFCHKNKLIIKDEKLYSDFVEIIADDITSNRFELYIIPKANTENYLNYFNFIQRDFEKIVIKEVKH